MQEQPIIGKYWQGHGGIYAGIIRNGDKQWHLILADSKAESLPWGEYGKNLDGDFSFADGQHNTALILAEQLDSKAALFATATTADGLNDFYLPSQKELMLCYVNLQEQFEQSWHWSSTQSSANCAWITTFEGGNQYVYRKHYSFAVRAVRRELVI